MKKFGVGIFALLGKIGLKVLTVLGKMGKALKVGKVGMAAGTMASYAYLFTWEFAVMVMALIFIHESGHVWAMKYSGMKTKGFYFIPFFGGAAVPDEAFPSRKTEFFVAIMGPIWGAVPVVLAVGAYHYTNNPLFAAAASWMAMVNLINLMPINPLDGGRIMKSIAFSIHSKLGLAFLVLGVVASGVITYISGMGIFVFLLIIGVVDLYFEFSSERERKLRAMVHGGAERRAETSHRLPIMSKMETLLSGILYISVALILWELMKFMKHIPAAEMAMEMLKG